MMKDKENPKRFAALRQILQPSSHNEQSTPPTELSSAIAGIIVNRNVLSRHVSSIPFNLAQRGFLTISQEEDDVYFQRTNLKDQGLNLSEQLILRDFFSDFQHTIPFAQLPPRLAKLMQSAYPLLKKEKQQALTASKKSQKRKWKQFARYLRQDTSYEKTSLFGQYFSYAVAFGVTREWSLCFNQNPKSALPGWYFTPQPEQQLLELVYLSEKITHFIDKQATPIQVPINPKEYANAITDTSGAGSR